MPHQRDEKVWLHLRDAICLNRTDIIAEALASQQINVDPDRLRKALYDVKELGIDACSVVDERPFRGSIKELIYLASGKNYFIEFPGRENKWQNAYGEMLDRATDQVPEFPNAYERSWSRRYYPGLPDYQHEANDAWFQQMLALLKPDGTLMVPNLGIGFNKQGEQVFPPLDDSETPSQFIMKHSAADDDDDPIYTRMVQIRNIMDESPLEMEELERRFGQVWSEASFNREFEPLMSTPIKMVAILKATGQQGTLWYQNNPRYYWDWQPINFSLTNPNKIVGITEAGMKHWDENRETTDVGTVIRAGNTQFDQELWILGLMYGAGPQDTFDLPPDARAKYFPIIDKLIADGYMREYPTGREPSHYTETSPQGVFEAMRDEARDSQNLMMDAITSLEQKINLLDELVRTLSLETRPDVVEKLEPIVEELEAVIDHAVEEEPEIREVFEYTSQMAPDVSVILTEKQLADIDSRAAELAGRVPTRSGAIPVIRHFLQNEARGRPNTIRNIAGELAMAESTIRAILSRTGLWTSSRPVETQLALRGPVVPPPEAERTPNEQMAAEFSQVEGVTTLARAYEVILFYLNNRESGMKQRDMAEAIGISNAHFQRILTRSGVRQRTFLYGTNEPQEPKEEQSIEDIFGGLERPERVDPFSKWRFR